MSVGAFRVFQRHQPDNERWELVEGCPVMMAPPTLTHQKIAGNLFRLLGDALAGHDEDLVALQPPGVELGLDDDVLRAIGQGKAYAPEPDVAVIYDTDDPNQRFALAAVLLAEIVSITDDITTEDGRAWIDVKAALYRAHRHCKSVLVVEQENLRIRLWQRTDDCTEAVLDEPDDVLVIDCCGLRCRVADIYARTHLIPRAEPRPGRT